MGSAKALLFAGAATLLSFSAASAADLPVYMPLKAPIVQDFSGWYLRGDIGMTNQSLRSLDNPDPAAQGFASAGMGFDSSPLFGIGLGYQVNNWLRFDGTGEYRAKANFHGSNFLSGPGFALANNYSGSKSEALFLLNAYVDLGTWWGVTPFIGAGVGTSYNMISGFRDDGVSTTGGVPQPASVTYAKDNGKWNLAWAAQAGLAYKVTPSFTVELAYRYVNLGSATTGANFSFDSSFNPPQYPWTMKDLTSQDVKLGVRWNLGEPEAPIYMPPLMRKG
jgi:opacity protein-like surface antigen